MIYFNDKLIVGLLMLVVLYFLFLGFRWIYKRVRSQCIPIDQPIFSNDQTIQEDLSSVAKAFRDQKQQMNDRSMRAHNASCEDNWLCTNYPCFVWQSDKIIGDKVLVKSRLTPERIEERNNSKEVSRVERWLEEFKEGICLDGREDGCIIEDKCLCVTCIKKDCYPIYRCKCEETSQEAFYDRRLEVTIKKPNRSTNKEDYKPEKKKPMRKIK